MRSGQYFHADVTTGTTPTPLSLVGAPRAVRGPPAAAGGAAKASASEESGDVGPRREIRGSVASLPFSVMSRKAQAAHRVQVRGAWLLGIPRRAYQRKAKQNDTPRHCGGRQQVDATSKPGSPIVTAPGR